MNLTSDAVLPDVVEELRALHDPAERPRLQMRHWVPRSERKESQRLFVSSTVDGTARYVAKVALDTDDAMVAQEWVTLTRLASTSIVVPRPVREVPRGFVMANVGVRDLPDALAGADAPALTALLVQGVELGAAVHTANGPLDRDAAALEHVGEEALATYPSVTREALAHAGAGAVHGDMGPWNFRVDDAGSVALIDWEDFAPRGVCALDVLNLVLTAGLVAYPRYRERGFGWLFDEMFGGDGPYQDAATAALDRYEQLTGEAPDVVLALTPVFCDGMVRRIRAQRRPTDHLFFQPLADRFRADPSVRIGRARV